MCSMKWAAPASPRDSRREPARTYAAMETERAPGIRAEMTRGPAGSTVRSNIAPILPDAAASPGEWARRPSTRRHEAAGALTDAGRDRAPGSVPDDENPVLGEVENEGERNH